MRAACMRKVQLDRRVESANEFASGWDDEFAEARLLDVLRFLRRTEGLMRVYRNCPRRT